MLFGQNRDQLRNYYLETWQKARQGLPLQPLEQMIADVIEQHPEYHNFLEKGESALEKEFTPEMGESNPFLHMGMHLAIHEQISTNRPSGISASYQQLTRKIGDSHAAEHKIMECLGSMLWQAQRSGTEPDEQAYLECIKRLA